MASELRVAKKRRLTGAVVTITVGHVAERETFHAHESILQERSEFFRAALSKDWKEGQEKLVELPEDKPDAFGAYVEWLFFRKIASGPVKAKIELTQAEISSEYIFLAHLYVLGEKLLDDQFCDGVIKAMTELCNIKTLTGYWLPSLPVAKIIYLGTSERSPARKFVVDMYLQCGRKAWIGSNNKGEWNNCTDFLLDLARAQLPESRPNRSTEILVNPQWLKQK